MKVRILFPLRSNICTNLIDFIPEVRNILKFELAQHYRTIFDGGPNQS